MTEEPASDQQREERMQRPQGRRVPGGGMRNSEAARVAAWEGGMVRI